MKLSILIPIYNAENYIANCIESLIRQNIAEQDYEIVIMDDGSTDNSVSIVSEYAKHHQNIKLHVESNVGAYSTRNKLLKLAKGKYIYNLDADDYIVHNCLEDLLNIATSNDLDIISFDTLETSNIDLHELSDSIEYNKAEVSTGISLIEAHRNLRHEIWWYFIKKDFIEEHKFSFNKNEYNADVVFTLEALLKAEKVFYLPISIHRYVQTESSLMRSKNFEVVHKRIEYMKMMVINKSELINNLNKELYSEKCIENISFRRDVFTFFNIINLWRNPFSVKYIKEHIRAYKSVDAFPIKNFIGKEYNSTTYKILVYLINKPSIIYPFIYVKSIFVKVKL